MKKFSYMYGSGTDKIPVAIRCFIDDKHYFDLMIKELPCTVDWYDATLICEKNYCRLPMKHEWKFILDNVKELNEMLEAANGDVFGKTQYWSSSEFFDKHAFLADFISEDTYGIEKNKNNIHVRMINV